MAGHTLTPYDLTATRSRARKNKDETLILSSLSPKTSIDLLDVVEKNITSVPPIGGENSRKTRCVAVERDGDKVRMVFAIDHKGERDLILEDDNVVYERRKNGVARFFSCALLWRPPDGDSGILLLHSPWGRGGTRGHVLFDHHRSLPYTRSTGPLLWLGAFVAMPAGVTALLWWKGGLDKVDPTVGLLAGVGVLGGLLFQVLAWISGRLGSLADTIEDRPPTDHEMALIGRLNIARANIAYATLVSIIFVVELGVLSLWYQPPHWTNLVSAFLLLHLGATLLLMVLRINRIGKSDRLAALTAHARRERSHV